jgi:hypothetical protein
MSAGSSPVGGFPKEPARPLRRVGWLGPGPYRLRGKPKSMLEVPGSGHRDVTTFARV